MDSMPNIKPEFNFYDSMQQQHEKSISDNNKVIKQFHIFKYSV